MTLRTRRLLAWRGRTRTCIKTYLSTTFVADIAVCERQRLICNSVALLRLA